MTPIGHFEAVWGRCSQLSALHSYLDKNVTAILQPDELLRAEWVARVSALDLYIHELIAQKMVEIFEARRLPTATYLKFQISTGTLNRIRTASTPSDASSAFDLFVRNQLSRITYQFPDDIADGVRLCSSIELWNEVAMVLGANPTTKTDKAKELKRQLSLLINRRNKIAHEGDLQQSPLREPWPISKADLIYVEEWLERTVRAIDSIV